ncbi:hypothetical protein C7M84_017480 [Penaeus vannamei]|uniref:Uncharacterized protein n=1 Tax=Penaeus vannamei TaxID=6689 RepID=A0A3R7LUE5_PENVA|nr:hypothetical protein C7M84_017480 [Penaeus vannamei]
MVLVPNPGNGVHITVNLTRLNSQVSRPTHPSPTPADAICTITPSAKFFTKADALHGYWQMDLAEEDRHLTTFITPHGRYYHCRGPMGFAATGDAYCLCRDLALQGITNCVKVVDDILLFESDLATHLRRVFQVLSRCAHGITLNKDKFMVAATNRASLQTLKRLQPYETTLPPSNITDLRSFMGLVNQLADFSPEIAATAQPLRPLMSPKRSFTWTPDHDQAFGKEHGHGQLRLVQCGSRFLTDESRYATIELEMLAASWAMGKCRLYLAGLQHFTLHTDHRPLIPILNHYTLDAIENPRLQRLRVKMAPYVFTAVWRAGKTLCVPDALSRAPVSHPTFDDEEECTMTAAHVRSLVSTNATSTDGQATAPILDDDRTLQELRANFHLFSLLFPFLSPPSLSPFQLPLSHSFSFSAEAFAYTITLSHSCTKVMHGSLRKGGK